MGALINKNTFEEERLFERGGGGGHLLKGVR